MSVTPRDVYSQMLRELSNELEVIERGVFIALRDHPDGLKRQQLVAIVFNVSQGAVMVNNDTKDRKVRKAIESLRRRGVPIVSSSGRAGYRLDGSEDGKREMLAELRSRRDRLNELILMVSNFRTVPGKAPNRQQSLF